MSRVSFNLDINQIYMTYSSQEYDRTSIDHVLYRKSYNRISLDEMNTIYVNLDLFKLYEMNVHEMSLCNNHYHIKKIII